MEKKLYVVLGVPQTATEDDIKNAYKKMTLKYHPDKNKSPEAGAQFKAVSKAYEVLSYKKQRDKYDKFGDNPVKIENPTKDFSFGCAPGFFNLFNNANNFDTFYGSEIPSYVSNPFFSRSQSTRNRARKPQQPLRKDPPITHDLYVSLEDVLIGCMKKMKIERNVLNPDKRTHHRETKVLPINVKPGWKAGTKITFTEEGDENPDRIPSDIVFIVKDKAHSIFERDGCHIRYNCSITLKQALCGGNIEIPTLTGEKIPYTLLEIIRPDSEQRFIGRGLPLPKDSSKRGDLIVTFRVIFPDNLTDTSKKILKECLPSWHQMQFFFDVSDSESDEKCIFKHPCPKRKRTE